MERRDFIRLGAVSLGAGVAAPAITFAETCKGTTEAREIYYTKDAPGRWSEKVATHLPNIEIEKKAGKTTVKIVTPHEMKGYEHYIVKHVLLDKNYKFIDEHMFNPMEDKEAISFFNLENYSGALYALSMCNKHDLWLNDTVV